MRRGDMVLDSVRHMCKWKDQEVNLTVTEFLLIEALARRYQHDALRIATMDSQRGHGDIAYQAVTVAPSDIENAVVNLLRFHEAETAILFCATRDNVRHLHATLQERGFAVVALSGEHSQQERNQALQALRDRRARVCVATDLAARGLDVPALAVVVNHDLPRSATTYTHRIGRTGRAGAAGLAVSFIAADAPGSEAAFRLIEKRQQRRVPREQVAGFEPTASPSTQAPADPQGGVIAAIQYLES